MKKLLFPLIVIVIVIFGYLFIVKDQKTIYDVMKLKANFLAESSVVFVDNLAIDELRNKIKLDMRTNTIKAIVIKDFILKENLLVAYKDKNNNIVFAKNLPTTYTKFPVIKENIIQKKSYSTTILGELSLYYDEGFEFNFKQNYLKLEFLQEEEKYLKNKEVIRMCVDPYWMPYEKIEYGKHVGITSDYIKIFEQKIGVPITLVITNSWTQTLQKAQQRECDIVSLIAKTKEREQYLDFTSAYINSPVVIATKVGIPFIDGIEQIQKKKIAIVKGYYFYDMLMRDYPNLNLVTVNSVIDGLKKVEEGTVFAYIDNSAVVNHAIQKDFIGSVTISGKLKYNSSYSVATRNDEPLLHEIFETVILSLDDATKEEIFDKWIKLNYSLKTDYTLIIKIVFVLLLVIFGIIYWNRKLALLNKELSIERDKAKQLTKAKSEFLANMSHEIRTPMNGIVGMAHLALECDLDEKSKNYIQKIDVSAKSLLNIINDILDFSKIEAGKLTIDKIDFDLSELIYNIVNLSRLKIEEKHLDIVVDIDTTEPRSYYGDPHRLSQILINLISNAIKFTDDGFIKIVVQHKENSIVEFRIEDSGIGLSVNQIDKLFQSFSQGDNSTTRKYGGTGLGLSISKHLVELLGGKIWVESKEDIGSSFIFEMKLPSKILLNDENFEIKNINSIKKHFQNLKDLCILLADDNSINQEIIIGLLEGSSIKIDAVSNGEEALNKYLESQNKYQLILMDIQMPLMNGLEATQEIRKLNQNIPIVALTASKIEQERENTKNIGMNDYLEKPIDINKLYSILYKYLYKNNLKIEMKALKESSKIPKNLHYIDTQYALKRLNFDESLYLKILSDFKSYYSEIKFDMLSDDDFKLTLHTIKGLSGNIGARKLHDIVNALENSKDAVSFDNFINEMNNVINELAFLNTTSEKKILKQDISEIDKQKLFNDLKEALKIKRPKLISIILEDLDNYDLQNDEKKYQMMKKAISKYKYKDALDIF
ncbi:MAG: transporter substrate-binding domain-containing protein [Arcobacteraceae bacterium]